MPRYVKAKATGFYPDTLRKEGDVFELLPDDKPASWMEEVKHKSETAAPAPKVKSKEVPDTLSEMARSKPSLL